MFGKVCRMTNRLVVLTTSLIVLIFIAGCPPVKPEPAKPIEVESPKVEPAKVGPPKVQPNEVEQDVSEPNEAKHPKAESDVSEPNKAEPPEPEPPKIQHPKAEPNELKPLPRVSFHDKCADILSNFVNDKGMVDYQKLRMKRPMLKKLLREFENLDRNKYNSWPKEDKIAFWTNIYNMQMLKIIVDNYPINSSWYERVFWWPPTSVRYIDKDIGGINKQKFAVMNEEFTLARIEDRFFREEFAEPRVFFAISSASHSSPPLRNEPYYGHSLYKQLEDQVKKFLSSTKYGFRINREKKRVYLSALLDPTWYGKDFISKYATNKRFKDKAPAVRAVLNFVTKYIPKQDVFFLERENYSVRYMDYDWRLNDSSKKQ